MQAPGEVSKIPQRAVVGIDLLPVVREIVVVESRFVKGCQQNGGDAQLLQIIDFLVKAPEVALAVAVGIKEAAFKNVINDFLREACGGKENDE